MPMCDKEQYEPKGRRADRSLIAKPTKEEMNVSPSVENTSHTFSEQAESTPTQAAAAERLLELIQMRLISEAIHVVAALGVADLLADAPKSANQLAGATGASASSLHRILRALASFGLFLQGADDRFALTPLGETLKAGGAASLHSAAMFYGGEAGANVVGLFLECARTGRSALEKISGGGNPFMWLHSNPGRRDLFNAMMTSYSILHLTGVLDAYDFAPAATIVDVGGGHGKILSEILKRNPNTRGVLFDLPQAFDGGQKAIAQAGLAERCEVISGDFFESVPGAADTYLLSRVIHDWDDLKAGAILRNVRRVIAPKGKLILLETMIRPDGTTAYPVLSDLNMLLVTGGCERTEAEYAELYRAAGFELTQTVATKSPTGTTVIEGRPI
jgi:ubiquinone/menaquinone biosynthesis C-methylase UbiE